MILSFVAYALIVSLCVSIAALAADRAAASFKLPRRFIWLAALIITAAWPIAKFAAAPQSSGVMSTDVGAISANAPPVDMRAIAAALEGAASIPATALDALPPVAFLVERFALILWIAASLFILIRLLVDALRLQRARRNWKTTQLGTTTVQISESEGPALIALGKMEIVLPSYVLMFEKPLRELILRHENEHLRARDPLVILAARIIAALFPWNAAIWWQMNRLRLALEIDCDSRVVRSGGDTERYARLLVAIAQTRSTLPLNASGVALTEGPSQLERRIKAMRFIPNRRSAIVASCAMLLGLAALAVAAEIENPPIMQRQWGAFYPHEVDAQPRMLPGNPPPQYPNGLRDIGTSGKSVVTFVIDENGAAMMLSLRVIEATDSAFTSAVRSVLPRYRFSPGELNNQPVRVWITLPFEFVLSRAGLQSDSSARRAAGLRGGGGGAGAGSSVARTLPERRAASDTSGAFFQFEVERMARMAPGNPAPRYPEILKRTGQKGTVRVSFVITEAGLAEMSTLKVLESTHVLFTEAVRDVLPRYRFVPASIGGRAVRMWVNIPFDFILSPGGE